jgi:MOSC domain-containing protein YiiM
VSRAELVGIAVREKTKAPMVEPAAAAITLEAGVEGDFRGQPGPRQVTVLGEEAWHAACAELGEELAWTLRRANLLVRGVDLRQTVGHRLAIGDVVLEVSEECAPCQVMDAQRDGLRAVLEPEWRAGVACRVVTPGRVAVGDAVALDAGRS